MTGPRMRLRGRRAELQARVQVGKFPLEGQERADTVVCPLVSAENTPLDLAWILRDRVGRSSAGSTLHGRQERAPTPSDRKQGHAELPVRRRYMSRSVHPHRHLVHNLAGHSMLTSHTASGGAAAVAAASGEGTNGALKNHKPW